MKVPADTRRVLVLLPCRYYTVEERIELWGLQIPHNSVRPTLAPGGESAEASASGQPDAGSIIAWSSVDRLNMSIGGCRGCRGAWMHGCREGGGRKGGRAMMLTCMRGVVGLALP